MQKIVGCSPLYKMQPFYDSAQMNRKSHNKYISGSSVLKLGLFCLEIKVYLVFRRRKKDTFEAIREFI